MSAQPSLVTTLEVSSLEQVSPRSPFQHAYCTVCNISRETAVSMCGAKRSDPATLRPKPDERPICAVCADLWPRPCEACGS